MRFLTLAFDLFTSRPIVLPPLPSPGYRRRFLARVSTIYISSSPPRECIKIARVNTGFRGGFFRLYLPLQRGLLSTEINICSRCALDCENRGPLAGFTQAFWEVEQRLEAFS